MIQETEKPSRLEYTLEKCLAQRRLSLGDRVTANQILIPEVFEIAKLPTPLNDEEKRKLFGQLESPGLFRGPLTPLYITSLFSPDTIMLDENGPVRLSPDMSYRRRTLVNPYLVMQYATWPKLDNMETLTFYILNTPADNDSVQRIGIPRQFIGIYEIHIFPSQDKYHSATPGIASSKTSANQIRSNSRLMIPLARLHQECSHESQKKLGQILYPVMAFVDSQK